MWLTAVTLIAATIGVLLIGWVGGNLMNRGVERHLVESRDRVGKPALRTATEAANWYPGWREQYKHDWNHAHLNRSDLVKYGYWARGDAGIDAWITQTPEWDRAWFTKQGMLLPRFSDVSAVYWRDYGDGLRGLSHSHPT